MLRQFKTSLWYQILYTKRPLFSTQIAEGLATDRSELREIFKAKAFAEHVPEASRQKLFYLSLEYEDIFGHKDE